MFTKIIRLASVSIFVIGLVAIQAPQTARAAGPWYVATTGDDSNDCLSPATPCATINGAIGKASSGDTIYIADGTYTGTGNEVVQIDKDITLSGGWNNNFTTLSGMSSIDGQEERRGILVIFNSNVTVENFIIQGGNSGYGGGIQNGGNIIINTSIIINNTAEEGGGLANARNMTLNSSFVSNNISTIGGGGGILNDVASTLTINNSTISENSSPGSVVNNRGGGGILNQFDNLVVINNSTVSGNVTAGRGGGIYNYGGTITTNNSTISNNTATIGGGIYNNSGSTDVTIKNTILAENIALNYAADCIRVNSMGYNLIGNNTNCDFVSNAGDLINTNPELAALRNNGGPTLTHALLPGSPAIDAGNPAGCMDQDGNLLTNDQRGVARPQGGACDIGAFELDRTQFWAKPDEDQVRGFDWPIGASVTMTINDTDYTETLIVTGEPWDPTFARFTFDFGSAYDLLPGDMVVLSDGISTKRHTVTNVSITGVDINADTVTGTADAGSQIMIAVCDIGCHSFRRVIADGSGNWMADFTIAGTLPDEVIFDLQTGMYVDAIQSDEDGDFTITSWNMPLPSFAASLPQGTLQGYDWPLGTDVTVTIDDPDYGGSVDYTDTQTVVVADWDPSTTVVDFPLDGFTLEPGQFINMTDGVTLKEHTVTSVTITDVDLDTETVSGTADPGTYVWVLFCDDSGCPEDQGMTADGTSGIWGATFTDIRAGDSIIAHQFDDDNDHTAYEWRVPAPYLEANPVTDLVWGYDWPVGSTVNLDINAGAYTDSAVVKIADWDPNQTYVLFELDGGIHDLQAGDVVELTGSGTTKIHTVTGLAITGMDALSDTVSGTTDASFDVDVWVHGAYDTSHVAVTPDGGTGDWDAVLPYDLLPGDDGAAVQYDADGDCTWIDWRVPNPNFSARFPDGVIHAYTWPLGASVTVEIDDPDNGVGVDYSDTRIMTVSPWDPSDTGVEFPLTGFTLEPGHVITMTDGVTLKELTVTNLTITAVDPVADTVAGIAPAGADVEVDVSDNSGGHSYRRVTANGSGDWLADFSIAGTEPNEGVFDIQASTNSGAWQSDADGDLTAYDWRAPNPTFWPRPLEDWISGTEWPLGATVYLDINAGAYTDSSVVVVAPWNPSETTVGFNLNGLHDLVPGDYVTLTDGVTFKDHTVTDLTVLDVNAALNTISGTTSAPFDVFVWEHSDHDGSITKPTPDDGAWLADLSPFDLLPGHEGAAVQFDEDGDGTWIEWWVPYTLTIEFGGTGSGTVNRTPGGDEYRPGTDVELEAIADPGSTFTGWSGDYVGSDNPVNITMDSDKTVTANFDLQSGFIIVEKQTNPGGAAESFEFNVSYGSNFTLADDETNNSGPLTAGIYSVSEINIPVGWNLTNATCDDGSDPSAIGLDAGETVTCIFTNSQDVGDDKPPVSKVKRLLSIRYYPKFWVRWDGNDTGGSGIQCYDIQFRDGYSSAWQDWQSCTTDTWARFDGQPGHIYFFRSRAIDNAGNVEDWPSKPDTWTYIIKWGWHRSR